MQPVNYIKKNKKGVLAIVFFIHFFFIITYSIRDVVTLSLAHDTYITRAITQNTLRVTDYNLSRVLLHKKKSTRNDYLGFYMALTGGQTPFNYFVSNIKNVEKVIFELEFKNGSHVIILPTVSNNDMAVRFKHFLNFIEITPNELYRDLLVKRLTEHEIRNYPNVKSVTTILGLVEVPSFGNYTKLHDVQFRCLYQYHYQLK